MSPSPPDVVQWPEKSRRWPISSPEVGHWLILESDHVFFSAGSFLFCRPAGHSYTFSTFKKLHRHFAKSQESDTD